METEGLEDVDDPRSGGRVVYRLGSDLGTATQADTDSTAGNDGHYRKETKQPSTSVSATAGGVPVPVGWRGDL